MTTPAASARSSVGLAIVGSGGAGVMTVGKLLLEAAARSGWHGLMTRSFGAQIRGGESAAMVRISRDPVAIHGDCFDILLAVDWNNFDRFAGEIPLSPESLVLSDPDGGEPPASITGGAHVITALPLQALVESCPGARANMIALGVLAALIGIPIDAVTQLIAERLGAKGEAAVANGQAAVTLAAREAATITGAPSLAPVERPVAGDGQGRWLTTGNQLAGLGALRGGVRFVAAYPITPATDILEWMAPELAKLGGTLVQAEDELASINMIIGGAFGGVPSLTATSGPGLSLMTEAIGLAIAAEVPLVVVDVMRCGPSTGIATRSEQSDLNIAIHGCHGDAPHIVVAPSSIEDCLFTAQWATHLAEAMQTAVIILSDQALGQTRIVIDRPGEIAFMAQRDTAVATGGPYRRYAATTSAVSPMALPGTSGLAYTADGLEHDEKGTPAGGAAVHLAQLDKRRDKLTRFNYGRHWADIEGDGRLAVITWGSSTPPVRAALARAAADGLPARLIALRLIAPAQPRQMKAALAGIDRVVVVEQTHSGQFYRYLRAQYDLPAIVEPFHKPGPLPLRVDEIYDAVTRCSKA